MSQEKSTSVVYELTGSTRRYIVPFEYLSRQFVVVTVLGAGRTVLTLGSDYRFISLNEIETTIAYGGSDGNLLIEIRRATSATARLVEFADGSVLRSRDMNVSAIQTIHIAEEARDLATTLETNAKASEVAAKASEVAAKASKLAAEGFAAEAEKSAQSAAQSDVVELRQDLANPDKGATIVSYRGKSVAAALDGAVNGYSVESFRSPELSDSNVIRVAIDWIRNNRSREQTRLLFEHGRKYTIDRTIEMGDVANLTIDLNGATLFRAPWTATTSTLAEATPVTSTALKMASIPENWEVSDLIMPYTGNGGIAETGNAAYIVAIDRETNIVTLRGAIGAAGVENTTLPAGTKIGKQIITFNGEYNVISENVKIINGTFDGNRANQRNMFWRYSLEVLLYGRNSEVSGCVFKNTQGECISGHGIRVSNNEFQDLNGSCFHTSLHDDIAATSGGSWFVGNSVKNVCLSGQEVNGHCEGAVTFSYGAGNLVVSGNQFDTGHTAALGSFGAGNEAEHADKWLIVTDNIFKNFGNVFYALSEPSVGVIVSSNIFINCGPSYTVLRTLADNPLSQIVGNVFAGDEDGSVAASSYSKLRIDNVTIGNITQKTGIARLVIGDGVPDRDLESAPYGNPGILLAGNNSSVATVTNASGMALHEYFEPTGYSTFTVIMDNSSYSYRLIGNRPNAKVSIEKAQLKLAPEAEWTPLHDSNTSASDAGLPVGTVYRTSDGTLKVVY